MYTSLKRFIKTILPGKVLRAAEPRLRAAWSILYSGDKVHCSVCDRTFSKFIVLPETGEALCPKCGSPPRKRLLWLFLEKEIKITGKKLKVLHFSPGRALKGKLKGMPDLEYITSDFESPYDDKQHDITAIDEADSVFDLVICYHILEHIPDDHKAMQELHRILKPGGRAILQVPLKDGPTVEDDSVSSPEKRKELFGQEDHLRHYGTEDFISRLEDAGFGVEKRTFTRELDQEVVQRNKLNTGELIIVCRK